MNFGEMPHTRLEADATALNGRSRLVLKNPEPVESLTAKLLSTAQSSDVESNCGTPDPLIQALVDRLPKPSTIWSIEDRAKWLRAAAILFNLIYKVDDRKDADFSKQAIDQKATAPATSARLPLAG